MGFKPSDHAQIFLEFSSNHLTTTHPMPILSTMPTVAYPLRRLATQNRRVRPLDMVLVLVMVTSCTSDGQTDATRACPTTSDREASCARACEFSSLSNRAGQCCVEPSADQSACVDRCVDECVNGTAAETWCP